MTQTINPYEVKGKVDYDRLIQEFGIKKISPQLLKRIEKITGEIHPYLRREIFFAHRDLENLLTAYDSGKKFFLYTGKGPSGPIHMGHYSIWSFVKWLQDKFNVELWVPIHRRRKIPLQRQNLRRNPKMDER